MYGVNRSDKTAKLLSFIEFASDTDYQIAHKQRLLRMHFILRFLIKDAWTFWVRPQILLQVLESHLSVSSDLLS